MAMEFQAFDFGLVFFWAQGLIEVVVFFVSEVYTPKAVFASHAVFEEPAVGTVFAVLAASEVVSVAAVDAFI